MSQPLHSNVEVGFMESQWPVRMDRSINSKAHPHRAGPIGCSGQQHIFKASVGMVWVPLPSCSKDPFSWSNGRSRPDQRPTTRDGQSPTRAPLGSHQDPTNHFLECKPKSMSQQRQTMPQSLRTGGTRARNVRPFLRGTGNPHKFWITEQDHQFS